MSSAVDDGDGDDLIEPDFTARGGVSKVLRIVNADPAALLVKLEHMAEFECVPVRQADVHVGLVVQGPSQI